MIRRGREGKGKEGKGRGEGKFGAEKIAAIYSANFGGASQTRGRGGEAETARCVQDVSLEK